MLPNFNLLGVIGSWTWTDQDTINAILDKIRKHTPNLCIISGARLKGASLLAEMWAKNRGNPILLFPPDWHNSRNAGEESNGRIIDVSTCLVSFWNGKSDGTMDTMAKGLKAGKPIFLSTPEHKLLVRIKSLEELKGHCADQ